MLDAPHARGMTAEKHANAFSRRLSPEFCLTVPPSKAEGTGKAGWPLIGIGGSFATPPLPHHRTYGSVSGGSADYAGRSATREGKPSEVKKPFGRAVVSVGLFASRQGPWGLATVRTAITRPTPRRRSSSTRAGPRFHCFQAMARNRRLIHASSSRNTDGVWQKPK